MKKIQILICLCLFISFSFAQNRENDSLKTATDVEHHIMELNNAPKRPNNPTRAGIYSAVMPGLGQFYNKKYWKIPIAWGGIGTGVGITIWNQNQYKRYRRAFLSELNGETHEFSNIKGISKEALGRTQDKFKRQRDYAIAITSLVYVLNILDAVVDAHLYDQKRDPDLAISPMILSDDYSTKAGVSVNFRF